MGLNEWLIIGAALAGPIFAVQAQKWLERSRASAARKGWVFETLMATRGARISLEHVRALNSIDLVFYGARVFGVARRSRESQAVIDAWRDYHNHLSPVGDAQPKTSEAKNIWDARGDELFLNLLTALATANNYKFERDQLRLGGYSPQAHFNTEVEQNVLRRMCLELLAGDRELPLAVKKFVIDAEAFAADKKWKADVLASLQSRAGETAPANHMAPPQAMEPEPGPGPAQREREQGTHR
jgi:hypothetical protein